ncbi:MAG: glutathione S-transferase family protein [Betaproteobacteria bacterium]
MKLYIGNKNYSSWSLRGWLLVKLSGEPFEEVNVPLVGRTPNPANFAFSPSGLVPCLHEGEVIVWDTMAIAGHLAERHAGMWPADDAARGWARSISAEMHAGFSTLRSQMTMCIRERVDVRPWSEALAADIARVIHIFDESRRRFGVGGAFLCGRFSIADCFYAPVAFRFRTYDVRTEGTARAYVEALLDHPFVREWEQAALAEKTIVDADEPRNLYRDKIAAV